MGNENGFRTRLIREGFRPYSVGGILASSPAIVKISEQKGPCFGTGPLFAGSPSLIRFELFVSPRRQK